MISRPSQSKPAPPGPRRATLTGATRSCPRSTPWRSTRFCRRRSITYLEVGSGNSTRFARRAIRDHRLRTRITSIDPNPRVEVERLCAESIRSRVEDIDLAPLLALEAGDICSSTTRTACSPTRTRRRSPRRASVPAGGVLTSARRVLPYDYPESGHDRHYSEQYCPPRCARPDPRFEIVLPNTFVSRDPQLAQSSHRCGSTPVLPRRAHGVSFWLRVRERG